MSAKLPKLHWSAHLWPGLPQLWTRGSWAGLALAVGFTVLANVLIATSLVWTEWLPAQIRLIGAAVLATVWVLAWIEGRADWRRLVAELSGDESAADPQAQLDAWYCQAQQAYLAGDWVAAEQTLRKLLKRDSRDAPARLMLATLLAHEDRTTDARRHLEMLQRQESAEPWKHEVAALAARLDNKTNEDAHDDPTCEEREVIAENEPKPAASVTSTEPSKSKEAQQFPPPLAADFPNSLAVDDPRRRAA